VEISSHARPASLARGEALEQQVTVSSPGEGWVALVLQVPGTCWGRAEAGVLALTVDGGRRQEIIVATGERPTEYVRALGALGPGRHVVRVEHDPLLSATPASVVRVHSMRIGCLDSRSESAFVWRHSPVLHYRAIDSPLDSTTTDTPLVLFYRWAGEDLEYHVIYSHEDEGTDLTGLLARWGHTTDIEWVLRVVRDPAGRAVREEFQGPDHRTCLFQGMRDFGHHPVLQVATRNGLVTDRVHVPHRVALAPLLAQPPGEPREGVQHRVPWVYRVSALEVVRQVPLEQDPVPASLAPADPRCYLYVQWTRVSGPAGPLETLVRVRGRWYSSAWGRRELACEGPDAESTAVKLPAHTTEADVEAIALRALSVPPAQAEVRLVRAFFLDGSYSPRPPVASGGACRLTSSHPQATVWSRDR
jgi:hypothetical protein